MTVTHTEREAETQAEGEGEAGSMQKPDVGLNPWSTGAKSRR